MKHLVAQAVTLALWAGYGVGWADPGEPDGKRPTCTAVERQQSLLVETDTPGALADIAAVDAGWGLPVFRGG